MTVVEALHILFGAVLVAIGVLAAALADRIRGRRDARDVTPRDVAPHDRPRREKISPAVQSSRTSGFVAETVPAVQSARASGAVVESVETPELRNRAATVPAKPRAQRSEPKVSAVMDGADDVILALVSSGYKKAAASEAAWACSASERTSIESWTAAALRRCLRSEMS